MYGTRRSESALYRSGSTLAPLYGTQLHLDSGFSLLPDSSKAYRAWSITPDFTSPLSNGVWYLFDTLTQIHSHKTQLIWPIHALSARQS